ncbi:gamma-mobile-trio integrase GmtZ [Pseudomonas hunanensis]|uniref:gamma-mobile-trio integrase GmtZ n=1 Tax=Pseudomonas hunanensis TaxID=1247546 RepID=UPI0030D7AEA7
MGKVKNFYPTHAEARDACIRMKITTVADYHKRRKEDPRLPSDPQDYYKQDWRGHLYYTGQAEVTFYNHEEAKSAAQRLGITTAAEYAALYKKDFRLPSRPDIEYALDWKGWNDFLDKELKYPDYFEAREIAKSYGFRSANDYRETCLSIDPRFYAAPQLAYKEWNGWDDYLGLRREKLYGYEQARDLVRNKGVTGSTEYQRLRAEYPRLPSVPDCTYKKYWHGWPYFLGLAQKPYPNYEEAQAAARALGVSTEAEYRECYVEDLRLPAEPDKKYPDWKGWEDFLGSPPKYPTMEEATAAVRTLGITLKSDYLSRFQEDPLLPKRPDIYYSATWPKTGWRPFLFGEFYPTMRSAAAAARKIGVMLITDYEKLRHNDNRLPSSPREFYKEYTTWADFIVPEKCSTLEEVKFVVLYLGIKNSKEYRERQPQHPCLPANPDRSFPDEWKDWFDLCNIIRPYEFEEALEKLKDVSLNSAAEYKVYIDSIGDKRFPLAPEKVYDGKWIDWGHYLGKSEPYTVGTLRAPYQEWQHAFAWYLRTIRSASTKENYVVSFVRDFLMPRNIGLRPTDIFTTDRIVPDELKTFIKSLPEQKQAKVRSALREFGELYVEKYLSIKCEDTGERVLVEGVRNPFTPSKNWQLPKHYQPSETVKPCLAFHHVAALRDWIIPESATSFSELEHLHRFDADWEDIDESLIDPNDPDCVYKVEDGKYKIWTPNAWMHTYALASVPLRGIQIAYLDSGEADKDIPVLADGKIKWIPNANRLRGKPKPQSFVKRYENDEIGMHITTNKTSRKKPSYDIPWIPESLAKWCIRFREWQKKYNPIKRAMPWSECTQTNLSVDELDSRGANCFLFRDFRGEECGKSFNQRLQCRIAAGLYYSQPNNSKLAFQEGNPNAVSSYTSIYTPHTMRVSLITAYVMDFRLPLEMIVKIAGHSSVVMTVYYVKINQQLMRMKFTEAEKRALASQAKEDWQKIQQGRKEQIRHELIINNAQAITRFVGDVVPGSALFRDYGICPFAAYRCHDGLKAGSGKWAAVPAGYLGTENCVRCRHFITGPAFLGGLLSLGNEISLATTLQFDHIHEMEILNDELEERAAKCRNDQHDIEMAGGTYDATELDEIESEIESNDGQISAASRISDMYLSDMNAIKRLIEQCQAVLNERIESGDSSATTLLIVHEDQEIVLEFEETSFFHQLSEVCENAQIYVSAKADLALSTRTNHLDRLLQLNDLQPTFFRLDKRQQLAIGNQVTQFLLARLGTWDKLDAIVDGRLLMRDLPESQRLTQRSLELLLTGERADTVLAHAIEHEGAFYSDNVRKVGAIEHMSEQDDDSVIEHVDWEHA